MKASKIKKILMSKEKEEVYTDDMFLHTGSILLNLACSNRALGGFMKGTYIHIVGDSHTGKTVLANTCFAETGLDPNFEDYRLIFDDAENGNLKTLRKLFPNVYHRVEPLHGTKKKPDHSQFLEQMYDGYDDLLKKGEPFIGCTDSMDALIPIAAEKKYLKQKEARQKGKEEKGSMGMDKAKINSENIRRLIRPLERTKSILLLISQSRDNMGGFEPKTNSGGHSMKFYAAFQIWSSKGKKGLIKKKIRGKDRTIGVWVKLRVKKNRVTGKDRTIEIPIYNQFASGGGGFDDIGSTIDWLVEEKHWKKSGKNIKAKEFKFSGTHSQLIKFVEAKKKRYNRLARVAEKVWLQIEEESAIDRKSRYA